MDSLSKARKIATLIDEMKGTDIQLLEVTDRLKITDFFLLATAASRRLALALADGINRMMKQAGFGRAAIEGKENGWWVLLDFGDVVVHIFRDEARAFYDLDLLYADAPKRDWHYPGKEQAG